ncbi:MAG TPA: KEOPS complex kinase/ATPase Bud32 [Nitrososphaera sp.]|nr:KEOPS complex kinase/ATPase Bud32 [Nitrososphaera sp.]
MQPRLVKKGAEADIYVTEWAGSKAVSKVRTPKPYRHPELDLAIRKHRTIHEANFISAAKAAGVMSPFVHFVDPINAEIIMEFVEGDNVRDAISPDLCHEMGRYAALLHASNIIHGDLTTSNFITDKKLVLLDFGLSYYSERTEDMATDIRLIKEVFTSAHIAVKKAFPRFVDGYASVAGKKRTDKILENVKEIEQRGRYARVI